MVINRTDTYQMVRQQLVDALPSNVTVVSSFSGEEPILPCVVLNPLNLPSNATTYGSTPTKETVTTITTAVYATTKHGQGAALVAETLDTVTSVLESLDVPQLFWLETRETGELERFNLNEQTILNKGVEVDFGVGGQ